jgi:hypothetical protein
MSQFEIPSAQTQYDTDARTETWYEIVNTGGYLRNGIELSASVNADSVLGFQPLFAVKSETVWPNQGTAANTIAPPGRASKNSYYAFPVSQLSTEPDGGDSDANWRLGLVRGFSNAGDDLVTRPAGDGAAGYIADETAVYRFSLSGWFDVAPASDVASSAYGLYLVVQRNGTGVSYVSPTGVVELANTPDAGIYSNRASFTTEVALEQGDVVVPFVAWIYAVTPLIVKKILFTGSKLTLEHPTGTVIN